MMTARQPQGVAASSYDVPSSFWIAFCRRVRIPVALILSTKIPVLQRQCEGEECMRQVFG